MLDSGAHPHLAPPRARHPYPGYCFALLCLVSGLAAFETRLVHWFLVPVIACGLITGRDAVDWLSGRIDPFHPRGVIGVVGVHLFFLAPLLLAFWDLDYDVVRGPDDWRPWLGIMAAINAVGLLLYRACDALVYGHSRGRSRGRSRGQGRKRHRAARPVQRWTMHPARAPAVLVLALLVAGMANIYLWIRFGGVVGQITDYESLAGGDTGGRFKYQLLAGALPILLLMLLSVLQPRRARESGRYSAAFLLLGLTFVLYFFLDGLRGSRSATVWTLFWATGIIHFFWRRLSARLLLAGLIPLLLFMYLYGFYKSYGDQVLRVYEESGGVSELSQRTGRTVEHLLIRDLSRTDVQAFLIFRLLADDVPYDLTWGATYAESVPRTLLPRSVWSDRPEVPRKALAGARIHFGGPSPYGNGLSKVYGLAGEGLLNFHIPGALLAFCSFGVAMGLYRRALATWPAYDARLFMAPFMANWFLTALIGDLDNLLTFSMTKAAFPMLILLLVTVRRREPAAEHAP